MKKIKTKGIEIAIFQKEEADFISLTDIARFKGTDTGLIISHWLSTRFTVEFMGVWEQLHNTSFNITEFRNIKNESGSNGFVLSVSRWKQKTNAIGIFAKAGRYHGGTFAHKDIAFEFASWISAEFKLYLIKEFQRLKEEENQRLALGWDVRRTLAKVNYRIHTDAVKKHLVPPYISKSAANAVYASEADVLNMALFGMTAKNWRDNNPKLEGNIRDYSSVEQLVVLANLEGINAEFIRQGLFQSKRLTMLNEIAIIQIKSLVDNSSIKKLEEENNNL